MITKRITYILTVMALLLSSQPSNSQEVQIEGNKFTVSGNEIWFNGINSPWHLFVDFGRDEEEPPADRFNYEWWTNEFARYKENNINLARVWIFCNGEVSPEIDETGYISGVNQYFYDHLDHLFEVSRENEVYIMPALLSFDITRGYHPKHP